MKTIQVTKRTSVGDVLPKMNKEEILVMREGHAVALVTPFSDEDVKWYTQERDPDFVASIARARSQIKRSEWVADGDLDGLFADTVDGINLADFSPISSVETLQRTKCTQVTQNRGVYILMRTKLGPQTFLKKSVGGWHKRKDPSDPAKFVQRNWIADAQIVYIGKGDGKGGLRRRLRELMDFGLGRSIGHRGGRLIWHMSNHQQLLVRWLETPDENPVDVEQRLINSFRAIRGSRPFANLNR